MALQLCCADQYHCPFTDGKIPRMHEMKYMQEARKKEQYKKSFGKPFTYDVARIQKEHEDVF